MVISYRQSRCFRRVFPEFGDVLRWANKHDVLLVSATENMGDPRQHKDLLLPLITAWTDQGDSETKSQIYSDLYARYREEGRWTGGKVPYGYRSMQTGPKRHDLAVDEAAAACLPEAVSRAPRRSQDSSLLLRVAYCIDGLPLYRWSTTSRGKRYTYYKCLALCRTDRFPQGCVSAPIPLEFLDDLATQLFLAEVGHVEITHQGIEGDDSPKKRLDALGKRIITLTAEEEEQEIDHGHEIARLRDERARLRA